MSFRENRGSLANLLKFTIFTLLMITFTLTLPLSGVSADQDQSLFFKDDFSNPDSGWPTGKVPVDLGSTQYDNSSYVINVDTWMWRIYAKNRNIAALKDLIVEVDVVMEAGWKGDTAGLKAGWVLKPPLLPELNMPADYYFVITPFDERAAVYTWEQYRHDSNRKGENYLLWDKPYAVVNEDKQNNNLRLVFKGNRIKAYLNNTLMVDTTDDNILAGHRIADLGFVEGKFIYLEVGKPGSPDKTTFRFDNFKLYRGTRKAFLVPEELKDSPILKERTKAAEDYGFDIGLIEYYGKTIDYVQSISKLRASQPVAIQILCQPGERSRMEAGMTGYTGEAVYDEVNLTDFALSEIASANSPVKKGEELKISVTAKNTGYLPIKQLSCNSTASDIKGNIIFSGKTEILDLPAGEDRSVEIIHGIPLSIADGDYKLKVVVSTPDTGNSGQSITREKESAFSISGISSAIITGVAVSAIVLLGIVAAIFFVIQRRSKKNAAA